MKDTLEKQFSLLKKDTTDLLKNKIFYCFAVLVAMIVPALFFGWVSYLICASVVVFLIFSKFENGLAMLLFLYPFYGIFRFDNTILYAILFDVAVLIFAVKYVICAIKKEKVVDWKFLLVLAVFVLYVLLPIRKDQFGKIGPVIYWTRLLDILCFLFLIYLVYAEKDNINPVKIIKIFLIGFFIANCCGLLISVSDRLQDSIWIGYYNGIDLKRFGGLFAHPNNNAGCAVFAFVACLYLIYTEKVNLFGYVAFFTTFLIGYVNMARQFLYVALIAFAIFVVLEIIKNKKNFYKKVLPLVLSMIVVMLVFMKITKAHIDRFTFKDLTDGYDVSNIETEDPGRGGLIKLYLRNYLSSAMIILFGRGITDIYLGVGLAPHNTFLEALWCTGLIGVILIAVCLVLLVMFFTKKKFIPMVKSIFSNPVTYLVVAPICALLFIECFFFNIHMYVTFTVFILTMLSGKKSCKKN